MRARPLAQGPQKGRLGGSCRAVPLQPPPSLRVGSPWQGLTEWKGVGLMTEWQWEKAPAGSVSREHQCRA